ncbi:hypothetical protein Tco_0184221 [Tanacetum coccineum]
MGKGLLGPNGRSGGTIEGKLVKHSVEIGIGGSKFGVGEGKVVSMGGIGGGAFAIRSIVSKDGRGGGGLVVDGGRSSRVSRKAWGEVGGVENNSSMGSRLMARGDEKSRLEKLVEDPKYSPMEVRMVDREEFKILFHNVVKGRLNRGRISSIKDVNGITHFRNDVGTQFISHFQNVLGKSSNVKPIEDPYSLFYNKLSAADALFMRRDVSDDEVNMALFDIDGNKAPRT